MCGATHIFAKRLWRPYIVTKAHATLESNLKNLLFLELTKC